MSRRFRKAALAAIVALVVALVEGCAPSLGEASSAANPGVDCGAPSDGEHVVVLVAGTIHDPRPALTSKAVELLRVAARDGVARDGRGARGSVAIVASVDGTTRRELPLTPRRADCSVEHGLQRDSLIEANVERVAAAVSAVSAAKPGLDMLAGFDNAVRGLSAGVLIVVSNGLSTDGGLDLRQATWNLTKTDLVAQLNARGLLADLLPHWRVLFVGLGETTGDQPPLTKPTSDTLDGYMCAIVSAGGAATCEVDRTPLDPTLPVTLVPSPVVAVPGVRSVGGPDKRVTTLLSDGALGFAADSAVLSPDARVVLAGLAMQIKARLAVRPDTIVQIRGYVADPPLSTSAARQELSSRRAAAVANALVALLAEGKQEPRIDAAGAGTPPGVTAIVHGVFDEAVAQTMRTVTVTF